MTKAQKKEWNRLELQLMSAIDALGSLREIQNELADSYDEASEAMQENRDEDDDDRRCREAEIDSAVDALAELTGLVDE